MVFRTEPVRQYRHRIPAPVTTPNTEGQTNVLYRVLHPSMRTGLRRSSRSPLRSRRYSGDSGSLSPEESYSPVLRGIHDGYVVFHRTVFGDQFGVNGLHHPDTGFIQDLGDDGVRSQCRHDQYACLRCEPFDSSGSRNSVEHRTCDEPYSGQNKAPAEYSKFSKLAEIIEPGIPTAG